MILLALTEIDPLLMNAFNTVNLAAACIITSVEHAEKLGIPQSKWVYLLGGAGTNESEDCEIAVKLSVSKLLTLSSLEAFNLLVVPSHIKVH